MFKNLFGKPSKTPEITPAEIDSLAKEIEDDYARDIGLSENPSRAHRGVLDSGSEFGSLGFRFQNVLEYHKVFHRDLWGRASKMSGYERETIADYLEILANSVGYRSAFLGSVQLLDIAASLRTSKVASSLLVEPWMSPYKMRFRDIKDLYSRVAVNALDFMEDKTGNNETRKKWSDAVRDLTKTLADFDLYAFHRLRQAVELVALTEHEISGVSLVSNMDYVLACAGDRSAMSRMAVHYDVLMRNDPFISSRPERADLANDLRYIVGRSWMRLAASVASSGDDPFGNASNWLGDIWLDLRYLDGDGPNSAEARGLVIPQIELNIPILPYIRRSWRDDRFGQGTDALSGQTDNADADLEYKRFIEAMLSTIDSMPDALDFAQVASGVSEETPHMDVPSERGEDSAETDLHDDDIIAQMLKTETVKGNPASIGERVSILDRIGASEGNSSHVSPEETFGRLLQPFELKATDLDPDDVYAQLNREFPWMREANRYVAEAVARTSRQKVKFWKLRPIILLGPPGTGKTRWVRRVAEIVGVFMNTLSMSGVAHTKSIIGSERGWSNARPSFMAYGFLSSKIANPIFYVDEIDKCDSGNSTDIQESFLPILEEETSRAYHDMYLLGHLNLTWSSFIFSANNIGSVSPILLSRLKPIKIGKPNEGEMLSILETMINEACRNESFSDEEIQDIYQSSRTQAVRIYRETGDLRKVRSAVEDTVRDAIWKPKGIQIVK